MLDFPGIDHSPSPAQRRREGIIPARAGRINFPNSCTPAAQPALLKGIAQLHSFQYAAAEKAFAEVPQADPHCAMAYWGLAMSNYRPLWDGADEEMLNKGRESLEKIKKDWPVSKREREYIDAIAIIFASRPRLKEQSITAYSRALAEICRHYPDDGEAQAFYALSLLALPARGDDTDTRKQVIDISEPALSRATGASRGRALPDSRGGHA